jgi:hypothetical protein
VVVELSDGRDAERPPHLRDPRRHLGGPRDTEDRAAGGMRTHVDQVQGMELDGPVEVTGAHHVDLVHRSGLGIGQVRVGHPLGDVAGLAASGPGEARSADHPFDRPTGRDRRDTHAAQLPGHRQRSVLGSGVEDQPGSSVQDCLAQDIGCPSGRGARRTGATLDPGLVPRLVLGPGRPLADPAAGPTER